ncbi:ABC transporter ATP-binding protein YvcR [Alkalibacterium sp. AK22]|uniref:ABC transporter ATP-binding protein n=1 Tax=Alkalibacterium sp. AK22 TaxID=1229520 RepID=UPI00044924E7|nr:ABC transporter ATP-binding protein [Alkalibacterium sp. AK22]EXJ23004.1 ABC transporter ATP-binding protein YvcR [Alkalibacterium sp. AK22]
MTAYIRVKDEVKKYKSGEMEVIANDNITFDIQKQEFAVIVGPSGAGKTTVLNILGGMDAADGGEVVIDGVDIVGFSEKQLTEYRRNDVGFVFQNYNLIPNLTAKENVELAAEISPDALDAEEILVSVGLKDRMDNFPAQLSGGEQQRVAIARALAKQPKLLLCDEPTGALDYETGKKVLDLLSRSKDEFGATVVVITHNRAIAPMADRVIDINNAKVRKVTINEHPLPVERIEW